MQAKQGRGVGSVNRQEKAERETNRKGSGMKQEAKCAACAGKKCKGQVCGKAKGRQVRHVQGRRKEQHKGSEGRRCARVRGRRRSSVKRRVAYRQRARSVCARGGHAV